MNSLTIYYGALKPLEAKGKHQAKALEFAYYNRGWHTFRQDRATKRAILRLAEKGYFEVIGDQFRFAPR